MALSITDLKKGTIFQFDGVPFRVVEYSQKVMGRGGSIVNVKIKSLIDGKVLDKTFKGNESITSADVMNRNVQYLYQSGQMLFFMDEDNYEQFEIPADTLGSQQVGYLKEGDRVALQLFDGNAISIELPKNVPLTVTYTENVVKGDTSSAITKDAIVETGIIVKVPAFVKQGDVIKVDTRNGEYLERVK